MMGKTLSMATRPPEGVSSAWIRERPWELEEAMLSKKTYAWERETAHTAKRMGESIFMETRSRWVEESERERRMEEVKMGIWFRRSYWTSWPVRALPFWML